MPKIAISYRRADSAAMADRIRAGLAARYGSDSVFMDIHNVALGSNVPARIRQVWSKIDVLLVLIGSNWFTVTDPPAPREVVRYGGIQYLMIPAIIVLVAHYFFVNVFDLPVIYLRGAVLVIFLLFGTVFAGRTRASLGTAAASGALLGVVSTIAMTVSASLRYRQPIWPVDTYEWRENAEFVTMIAASFAAGPALVRLPVVSRWFPRKFDWVRFEIEVALKERIPIIPVLLDGTRMPLPGQLPKGISEIAYNAAAEIHSGLDFDAHLARLIEETDRIPPRQS
jgi:hypothetical protein